MWAIVILIVVLTAVVLFAKEQERVKNASQKSENQPTDVFDDLLAETERMKLCVELMIQSEAVGDTATHDAVMNGTYQGPWPEPRSDGGYLSIYDNLRILKIAGINYRQGISRYTGRVMTALVPEPANEFDPNAIKIVAEDRHHLGYIPTDQTDMVRSMTGGQFPYRCECHIYEAEDEYDGHKFFYGFVYIVRKDKGE